MLLLKARLALELPPINKALSRAAEGLPHPVRPIARHIFEAGGKRLRPLLTILMARLLGYDKKDIYDLAVTMEMPENPPIFRSPVSRTCRIRAALRTISVRRPTTA